MTAVTVGYKKQLERCVQDEEGEGVNRWEKAMSRSDENIMYGNIKMDDEICCFIPSLHNSCIKKVIKWVWGSSSGGEVGWKIWLPLPENTGINDNRAAKTVENYKIEQWPDDF